MVETGVTVESDPGDNEVTSEVVEGGTFTGRAGDTQIGSRTSLRLASRLS